MKVTATKVKKLEREVDDRIREKLAQMTPAESALWCMRYQRHVETRLGNKVRVAELDAEIAELAPKLSAGGFTDPVTEQWCKEYVAALRQSLEEDLIEEFGYA